MTENPSRRTFVKGVAATGTAATGLAAFGGQAAGQDEGNIIEEITAVQRGAGLVLVQLQVTDAVDIGSIEVTVADNEVIKNVGNNNNITVPVQVSGNQVGANVAVAVLGAAGNVLEQDNTTVSEQTTGQTQ